MTMKNPIVALCLLLASMLAQAESAFVVRGADLQEQNQSDSPTLATLTKNTRVEVLRRLGAWSQVKTADGKTGWTRMTALRFVPETGAQVSAKPSGNALGALNDLLSSGRTSNSATATTGVRGLTEEDLQNAQANPGELEKARQFAVASEAAKKFARGAKLSASEIDYLPAPRGSRQSDSGEE